MFTAREREEHVKQWRKRGGSQRKYAADHGIGVKSFNTWCRDPRYSEDGTPLSAGKVNRQYSDEERQSHLKAWKASGRPKSEYAMVHAINENTFYGWTRPRERGAEQSRFIELPSLEEADWKKAPVEIESPIIVEFPEGIRISLSSSIGTEALERVFSAARRSLTCS
jgi:transposase-like protein